MEPSAAHRHGPLAVAPLLLTLTAGLCAQTQCAPPDSLATQDPFWITHYYNAPGQNNAAVPPIPQNLPAGYRGHVTFCDLAANADLSVSQIDFRLNDDGFLRYTWGVAPGVAGGIGLVGQTTQVDVYMTPSTWKGDWPTTSGNVAKALVPPGPGSPWTLLTTGTLTVQRYREHSPAVMLQPFTVPQGTNGFAFVINPVTTPVPAITYQQPPYALHPSLILPSSAPGVSLTASDQFLSITNQDVTNQAFVTLPLAVAKGAIFELFYTVASTAGYHTRYGAGCYDAPRAFYEEFEPGTFDLSGQVLAMTPSNGGYAVAAGSSAIVAPASTPLSLGDDARTASLALGFTFPYPGGSTSNVVVTSNGNVFLDPANSGAQVTTYSAFRPNGFLKGQPQLAALWSDLDPSSGGGVHFDVDLGGAVPVAYVTWNNVPTWNEPGSSNTVQVAIFGDGRVEYRFGPCSLQGVLSLTGFNPGFATHDPGNRDLNASVPFQTGNGAVPPALSMDARPILGTSPNLVASDLPTNTSGIVLFGVPINGVNMFFTGMPGCVRYVMPLAARTFQAVGGVGSTPLVIPNCRILRGLDLTAQALVVSPGSNAAGVTTSNPLCIRLGN